MIGFLFQRNGLNFQMFDSTKFNYLFVTVAVYGLLLPGSESRLCQAEFPDTDIAEVNNLNGTDNTLYHCPRIGDPSHFTECCLTENHKSGCCEKKHHPGLLPGIDDQMLMFVSAAVIITCLISMIIVLICCFCSKCPLYSVCHSKYYNNDAIAFSTKEEMEKLNGMPDEDYNIQQNSYEPNAVKVRPVVCDA